MYIHNGRNVAHKAFCSKSIMMNKETLTRYSYGGLRMHGNIMSTLRNLVYWGLDGFKGQPVKSAYDEISIMDQLSSNDPIITKHQEANLGKIINHAISTTDFYSKYKGHYLDELPVINKNVIREQQERFLSMEYKARRLFEMRTSGSTGTPFVCYQNSEKKRRVNAEVIYYSEKAGYAVGRNLVFLRALTGQSRKSSLKQWIQNETLIDIGNLNDTKIESLFSVLRSVTKKGSMMLAYASTYDALRDYFRRNGFNVAEGTNIVGIISGSEMLFDDTRKSMEKAFGCKVFSRYSNQENGIIGQDDLLNNVFILNEANYIVEILDLEKDVPVPDGTVGRIVITDLYNKAMPLIRYDTGDIGCLTYVTRNGQKRKAISSFGGRKIDVIYDSLGNRLSPHLITNHFWSFPEVRQYQFIQQSSRSYLIKLNVVGEFERLAELRGTLQGLLGEGATLTFEFVAEIPVLASGKRKYIVNNMSH